MLAFYFSYNYQLQEIMGIFHLKAPNHLGLIGHLGSPAAASSCGSPPFQELGCGRGEVGCPSEACDFFYVESQVHLGRETRVATWAYVSGWCSYTPEPVL